MESPAHAQAGMTIAEIRDILATVRRLCEVAAVDPVTHDRAIDVAEYHHLSILDALIVASALAAGCSTLWSEDLHHGHRIEMLTVRNRLRQLIAFAQS